jgi:hypothetical protein
MRWLAAVLRQVQKEKRSNMKKRLFWLWRAVILELVLLQNGNICLRSAV